MCFFFPRFFSKHSLNQAEAPKCTEAPPRSQGSFWTGTTTFCRFCKVGPKIVRLGGSEPAGLDVESHVLKTAAIKPP